MNDITAVVLTIGEETTSRAIASIETQTLQPAEIVVIENVSPFHRALNLGASKVKTEFFVQVDSDMILDENCLEELKKCMAENVGIAIGQLRDPLLGVTSGIKMFSKECFKKIRLRNSVSPDTDFYNDMQKHGGKIRYALNLGDKGELNKLWFTFGEHRPAYTPIYTYSKYYVLGRRYRYRRDLEEFKRRFLRLQNSRDTISIIAQIALGHGIFSEEKTDLLRPSLYTSNEDFNFLEKFLRIEDGNCIKELDILYLLTSGPKAIFTNFCKLGIDLRRINSSSALGDCMGILDRSRDDFAWIAKVGLCHGIFWEAYNGERVNEEYEKVRELL